MIRRQWLVAWIAGGYWFATAAVNLGGMPALLPSTWTKESSPATSEAGLSTAAPYLQAISFFVVVLLVSAWAVKGLWQYLRKDMQWLPSLTYGRSLSLVVLWGLLFVVVLTMISGARELMTPGAWQKQGWTYQLAKPEAQSLPDSRAERRAALERLRLALWQYAATHEGQFPADSDPAFDHSLWQIPHWPGQRFRRTSEPKADDAGRLLVYEPELEGDEREVILTNGLIGTMRTVEIRQALRKGESP
jgi:hypothetical protein